MYKGYRLISVIVLGLYCVLSKTECDTAVSVKSAISNLNQLIADRPLTDNDKTMIKTIVSARLEGRMLKIAPDFSPNGIDVYGFIIEQSACMGGFETLKGIAYGIDVLQIMQ